jgi:multidrug efflux pump
VATICGHFPLTLVRGPGAAARNSIGLVLVAGMVMGTAFTLFFVPAIYVLIAREHRAVKAVMPPGDAASGKTVGGPIPPGSMARPEPT